YGGSSMKRNVLLILSMIVVLLITSCSGKEGSSVQPLTKEGVAPYKLSHSDRSLLHTLGLEHHTNIISFKAPEMAKSLNVRVCTLEGTDQWDCEGPGRLLLRDDDDPRLEGTFVMLQQDDAMKMHLLNKGSRATFPSVALEIGDGMGVHTKVYLNDFEEIELNKEIPVALMVYSSGDSIPSFSIDQYFSPDDFKGMEIVQAVTLTFSDGKN